MHFCDGDAAILVGHRSEEVSVEELLTSVGDGRREGSNDEGEDEEDVKVSLLQPRNLIARLDDDLARLAPQNLLVVGVEADSLVLTFGQLDLKRCANGTVHQRKKSLKSSTTERRF